MCERILGRAAATGGARADDNEATIKSRVAVFVEQSVPVVEVYEKVGKVRRIDANHTVDEVWSHVEPLFDPNL